MLLPWHRNKNGKRHHHDDDHDDDHHHHMQQKAVIERSTIFFATALPLTTLARTSAIWWCKIVADRGPRMLDQSLSSLFRDFRGIRIKLSIEASLLSTKSITPWNHAAVREKQRESRACACDFVT